MFSRRGALTTCVEKHITIVSFCSQLVRIEGARALFGPSQRVGDYSAIGTANKAH